MNQKDYRAWTSGGNIIYYVDDKVFNHHEAMVYLEKNRMTNDEAFRYLISLPRKI